MAMAIHDHTRWGAGDQLGAGNHLTPEKRLEALALVSRAQLFELGQTIEAGAPRFEPVQTPYLLLGAPNWQGSLRRRRQAGATNDAAANLDRIEMTTHVGSHIDALGHFTCGAQMYGGFDGAANRLPGTDARSLGPRWRCVSGSRPGHRARRHQAMPGCQ
jgi:hypothetical protein